MKRMMCMVLSLLVLLPALGSCKGNGGEAVPSDTNPSSETTGGPSYADDLPQDLNFWDEEILIACRGGNWWEMELNVFEPSDTIVNDAVYRRNLLVQDRLAVRLRVIPGSTDQAEYMGDIQRLILGGVCEYDIVAGAQYLAQR